MGIEGNLGIPVALPISPASETAVGLPCAVGTAGVVVTIAPGGSWIVVAVCGADVLLLAVCCNVDVGLYAVPLPDIFGVVLSASPDAAPALPIEPPSLDAGRCDMIVRTCMLCI